MPTRLPGSLRVTACLLGVLTGSALGQLDKEPPKKPGPDLGQASPNNERLIRRSLKSPPIADPSPSPPASEQPDRTQPRQLGDGAGSPDGPVLPLPGPVLGSPNTGIGSLVPHDLRRAPITHATPGTPAVERRSLKTTTSTEPSGPLPPDDPTSPKAKDAPTPGSSSPEDPTPAGPQPGLPQLGGPLEKRTPVIVDRVAFWDSTLAAGIDLDHAGSSLPAAAGSAWLDYDRDGDPDLFLSQTTGASALYRNEGDGTFTAVTDIAGAGAAEDETLGASAADYDGDGWLDLLLLNHGPDRLLRNTGDGRFVDVTAEAGIAGGDAISTGAAWADYDGDGDLDLYVTTAASAAASEAVSPSDLANRLYRNEGDGRFEEIATSLGVACNGSSFGAVFSDLDGDGDPDLLVAHDAGMLAEPTRYYRNDEGSFTELPFRAEAIALLAARGIAAGDLDGDGDLDLLVAREGRDLLALNEGAGSFIGVGSAYGLVRSHEDGMLAQGRAAAFLDYDGDGHLDLLIAQGAASQPQPLRLYRNLDGAAFVDVSELEGLTGDWDARTLSPADFDGDGDLDVLVGVPGGRYRLLINRNTPEPRSLSVQALSTAGSPAVGARIVAHTPDGRQQMRQVGAERTLLSSPDSRAIFGLGEASQLESIEVTYPSGLAYEWRHRPAGETLIAVEPILTIESSHQTLVGSAGQLLYYTLTFTNHTDSQALAAEARIDVNRGSPRDHPLIPATRIGVLSPGTSVSVDVTLQVPLGTPPGDYALVHRISEKDQGESIHQIYLDVIVQ